MRFGVRRQRRAGRPWRAALLATVLAAFALSASAGSAQEDAADSGSDSRQPIEISADTLEVRQSENVAVFQGDVNAVQGEMVLTADTLTVHYREVEGGQGNLGVSRIEAEGSVAITSPEERAEGQRGVYDVEAGRIDLTGGVVLNQGNNIVEGETLTMNLETGVSRVSGAGSTRVHGLFVPEEESE
jgi:lipopolysaccharide export system protein LptA